MKIRLFDKFDKRETIAIYNDVYCVSGNSIIFKDGEEEEISPDEDWEELN